MTAEAEVGKILSRQSCHDQGIWLFCGILPGKDGLVHLSELANFRVKKTRTSSKVGDDITVKCLGVDEKGRVRLSRKAAMEDRDKEAAAATESATKPSNPGEINSSANGKPSALFVFEV